MATAIRNKVMDKNKLLLPISVLMGCIILGGFYYAGELNKTASIERQQQRALDQGRQDQSVKDLESRRTADTVRAKEEWSAQLLEDCLTDAEERYNQIAQELAKAFDDGKFKNVSNPQFPFDDIKNNLQNDKDECFKKYPQG